MARFIPARAVFGCLLALFPLFMQAMHIIGGEITYECLGEITPGVNRFRFTMKIYRDCNGGGADFDKPAQMAIYRGTLSANTLFEDFCVAGQGACNVGTFDDFRVVPDTPECVKDIPNRCVEQGTYVFTKDLPILQNASYFIVYQRCCRNITINNIVAPGSVGATFMVEITPAAQTGCNNSPVFKDFPPVFICNNFALLFDHGAVDADGDQLVYSFCSPLSGGGPLLSPQSVLKSCDGAAPDPPCGPPFDNVPFTVPTFTPTNPMGGNPQVSINSSTGVISGTPNILGQFVVGVCVQEFRNGVLLSTIRRDFQFNVTDCQPAIFADIATDSFLQLGSQRYRVKACGTRSVTLNNRSEDQNFVDFFRWEFNFNNGDVFVDSVNWNATVVFPDTGYYEGVLLLNPGSPCSDTAFIFVDVYPPVSTDFAFVYDTCEATPVEFTDLSASVVGLKAWNWSFGVPGGASAQQNPDYQYPIPGNHPVKLRVTDNNICSKDTTKVIEWFPAPPLIILKPSSFIGCIPTEITFTNLSTPIDDSYTIIWDFGDGTIQNGPISPNYTYLNPGIYTVSVAITSPIGCYITDTFPNLIRAVPSPTAGFTYLPDSLLSNFNNTIQFFDQSVGANRWFWQLDRYETTNERNPSYSFPDTGRVCVLQVVTHPEGCKDSISRCFDIQPEVRWFMPNAFTPNGDGSNDDFFGKGYLEGSRNFQMAIWNRWGEMVFETTNPNVGWNGRYMNSAGMSPQGVYVYVVTFTGPRGEPFEFKGFVTLLN